MPIRSNATEYGICCELFLARARSSIIFSLLFSMCFGKETTEMHVKNHQKRKLNILLLRALFRNSFQRPKKRENGLAQKSSQQTEYTISRHFLKLVNIQYDVSFSAIFEYNGHVSSGRR